ncbi:Ankyrin repeat-containing protein [Artemisia annua]|uniref:Ankyrin repeat-containing protein n=1 Tax=Artemisia annua TaxID=35608 RepID=A0A2U1MKB4_ARTAN|nr:Ankyrin repeat-containing protein [Artemisia annua]
MAAKKVESLEADFEKYREEVKGNFAALGSKLDSEVDALRRRQELEDKRYEELKNMLLSLTNKYTSPVKPVEPFKKIQTGLKFDDLGFPLPPINKGTSADGGRKKSSEMIGEADNSWGDYEGFEGSNRINLVVDDGTLKDKNQARNTSRTGFGTRVNHTEGRFFNHGYDHRMRKIKMPLFDGEDAHGWIYKAERYFEVIEVDPLEQLRAAVLCMEGLALSWFCWSEARAPFCSCEELKRRLLDRFQPSQQGNLYEQFLAITQDGSAREYVGLFEQLAGQLRGVSEEVMEGTFIKGLKPDLRSLVRVMQLVSLGQAMKLSIMIDENKACYNVLWGGGSHLSTLEQSTSKGENFRRLMDSELQAKKAKGLCYRCDNKFAPGHRCPSNFTSDVG